MIDRRAAENGGETLPDPVLPEVPEDGDEPERADSEESGDSAQDFSAVFEPVVDDAELRAFEKIEETQESLEHELSDSFVDESGQSLLGHAVGQPENVTPSSIKIMPGSCSVDA